MLTRKQPSDVLRKLGKWTRSTQFTKKVAEELHVSEAHVWRIIKKDPSIMKEKLPSGQVLCGLAEFGPPQKTEVVDEAKKLSEKEKIELAKELVEKDPRSYLWADPFQHYLNVLDKREKELKRKFRNKE